LLPCPVIGERVGVRGASVCAVQFGAHFDGYFLEQIALATFRQARLNFEQHQRTVDQRLIRNFGVRDLIVQLIHQLEQIAEGGRPRWNRRERLIGGCRVGGLFERVQFVNIFSAIGRIDTRHDHGQPRFFRRIDRRVRVIATCQTAIHSAQCRVVRYTANGRRGLRLTVALELFFKAVICFAPHKS